MALCTFYTRSQTGFLEEANRRGKLYFLTFNFSLTAGVTQNIEFIPGADLTVLTCAGTISRAEESTIQLIEAPTVTDGTTLARYNSLNRMDPRNAKALVYTDPTGVSGGLILSEQIMLSGKQGVAANTELGVTTRIFHPSKKYIIAITNNNTNEHLYTYRMCWAEARIYPYSEA